MRGHSGSERFVLHVVDPEDSTRLFHQLRDRWIIRVTDPGKQMVFDLEVQASKEPSDDAALPGKVHGRLDLMDCPGVFDASLSRHGEGRLFHAVGKLKHDTQHDTKHQRGYQVVEEYDVRAVKQQRNSERRGEEDRFTDQENDEVPLLGARDSMFADPPSDELSKIIELPLDCQQSIQWPEVKVLPPVKHEPLLMRR